MSLEVDGAAILELLARNPQAFAMGKAEVNMIAMAAVVSRLKKGVDLPTLRSIAKAIGADDFSMIVGDLPAKDAKSLGRLDAGHPDYAAADEHWLRAHIIQLAIGEAEPVADGGTPRSAPSPPKRTDRPKLPKIGKIMASAAQATAARTRKPRARMAGKGRK